MGHVVSDILLTKLEQTILMYTSYDIMYGIPDKPATSRKLLKIYQFERFLEDVCRSMSVYGRTLNSKLNTAEHTKW